MFPSNTQEIQSNHEALNHKALGADNIRYYPTIQHLHYFMSDVWNNVRVSELTGMFNTKAAKNEGILVLMTTRQLRYLLKITEHRE